MESAIIAHFGDFLLSFSHVRNMMPPFPQHTSYTICELPLSWNTSWGPTSAGVGHGERWKTRAILQNQDFCLIYLYISVGITAGCRLAVVGSAGVCHTDKLNQTADRVCMREGSGFLPPAPFPISEFKELKLVLSNFKWVLLCAEHQSHQNLEVKLIVRENKEPHASRACVTLAK